MRPDVKTKIFNIITIRLFRTEEAPSTQSTKPIFAHYLYCFQRQIFVPVFAEGGNCCHTKVTMSIQQFYSLRLRQKVQDIPKAIQFVVAHGYWNHTYAILEGLIFTNKAKSSKKLTFVNAFSNYFLESFKQCFTTSEIFSS